MEEAKAGKRERWWSMKSEQGKPMATQWIPGPGVARICCGAGAWESELGRRGVTGRGAMTVRDNDHPVCSPSEQNDRRAVADSLTS